MMNLLPGDHLWNRYRVESIAPGGVEGIWLTPLQKRSALPQTASRFLMLPLSNVAQNPLTELLLYVGRALRPQPSAAPKGKKRRAVADESAEKRDLPLLGFVEWIGEPNEGGVAVVAMPPALPLSEFFSNNGPFDPAQIMPLAEGLALQLQELLKLLNASPSGIPSEALAALARLLNPGALAIRTDQCALTLLAEIPKSASALRVPEYADFSAPEIYRDDTITPASLVFGVARLSAWLVGASKPQVLQTTGAEWAALAEWASGKRDPSREFSDQAQNLPKEFRELVESCLAKKRAARLNSPEKLKQQLKVISECEWAQSGRMCELCGFLLIHGDSCPCCGRQNPAPSKSSSALRASGGSGARKGTALLKKLGSASSTNLQSTAVAANIEGMVVIEAGSFLSGESKTPRTLRAYAIDTHPVTEADYKKYLVASGRAPRVEGPGSREGKYDSHPVTGVTWYEASDFAEFYGKRLPTMYEWEKAARGTDGRKFPYGNTFDSNAGNLRISTQGEHKTSPAGAFPSGASPYGVHDMGGNVLQWTSSARRAGERLFRAVKGACFMDGSPELARCSSVQYFAPDAALPYLGFRCVKDLE